MEVEHPKLSITLEHTQVVNFNGLKNFIIDYERLYTKSSQPQDKTSFIENKYCSCRRVPWNIKIHENISNVFLIC